MLGTCQAFMPGTACCAPTEAGRLMSICRAGRKVKRAGEDAGATKGNVGRQKQDAGLKPGVMKTRYAASDSTTQLGMLNQTGENICGAIYTTA